VQLSLANFNVETPNQTMKKVFLTGASSGIGLAIARALVARGDEVWGTSRDPARLQLPGLHPLRLDLAGSNSIEEVFKGALSEAGHFDVVINNAGSGHFGPAEHLSDPEIEKQFQILVFGHLQLMRLAIAAMRSREGGLVINVTSLASRLPVPFMAAYNAAKAAMAAFTMSIQLELPDANIRVLDLQPADIATQFNDAIRPNAGRYPQYENRLTKTWAATDQNMKNAPTPDLVAKHVLHLIDSTNPPPRLTVGDIFQSKIAPFIFRFLPQRVRIWGLKKYYGL
jgi:NAD(P)-dependent dehydrogenase (short-subunit alcohol dehydrogenase family)